MAFATFRIFCNRNNSREIDLLLPEPNRRCELLEKMIVMHSYPANGVVVKLVDIGRGISEAFLRYSLDKWNDEDSIANSFASAKAGGADIYAISWLKGRIGALDTSGTRQVTLTAIALNLQAGLVYSCTTIPLGWVEGTTYFGFHPAGVVVFYETIIPDERDGQAQGSGARKTMELRAHDLKQLSAKNYDDTRRRG
ncbi:hypothetical protein P692DRAFT_201810160 [Suillus brevipes Sb2]|nr:hypothetical protein P692DRAFT_201810160 [Suillus brevipes Sb2]